MIRRHVTALIGSREFAHREAITTLVATLKSDGRFIAISGGARGVDRWAAHDCKKIGLAFLEAPANWDYHSKAAGKIRNQTMAEVSDCAFAFWDGFSYGTRDMIDRCARLGKPVVIIKSDNDAIKALDQMVSRFGWFG